MLFWLIFGNFLCSVVTLVTFSSNLSNFERNAKKTQKQSEKLKKSKHQKKNIIYNDNNNPQKKIF